MNNVLKEYDYVKEAISNGRIGWSVEKNAESNTSRVAKANKGKLMLLSECEVCHGKRWRFIKEQESSGLLSNLGLKTPLIKFYC